MNTETIVYIILSGILALLIALFQYKYKARQKSKISNAYALLRFITVFAVLLLIINPKLEQLDTYIERPNLIVAVDNSKSVSYLEKTDEVLKYYEAIANNESLNDKFNIISYSFAEELQTMDSLSFNGFQTNITNAFNQLNRIYKGSNSPTVIISDGNQTYGNTYEFVGEKYNKPIYPIVVGDTTKYMDLKIQQLNVNRYAYLKNRFPIEIIALYNGEGVINSTLQITSGNQVVFSQPVALSEANNSKVFNITLVANTTGTNTFRATLMPLENEKNSVNNSKNFAIEVIDQKTNIAIVSDFIHPDMGTFKKSIESNEQRSAQFLNPAGSVKQINDFQLFILYQPNNKFKNIVDQLYKEKKNSFIVVGPKTDLTFLNSNSNITYEITNQKEEYLAFHNSNFTPFYIENIGFESFPPLLSHYGSITSTFPYQTILYKNLNGRALEEPLLITIEEDGQKQAILFGEGIWKWRAQSFLDKKTFNDFDDFISKLMQYLASNKQRQRLNVEYESFYDGNSGVVLKAQFFDKNYVFNSRETINITLTDSDSKEKRTVPFILKNNNYQVNLSGLPASKYDFTVYTNNEKMYQSGSFEILEYDVEQQFLNADVTKLEKLATNSEGNYYFIGNGTDQLISDLINDKRFKPIQKSNKRTIPLIDWTVLLFIIALSLSIEWFLRKYNGLT